MFKSPKHLIEIRKNSLSLNTSMSINHFNIVIWNRYVNLAFLISFVVLLYNLYSENCSTAQLVQLQTGLGKWNLLSRTHCLHSIDVCNNKGLVYICISTHHNYQSEHKVCFTRQKTLSTYFLNINHNVILSEVTNQVRPTNKIKAMLNQLISKVMTTFIWKMFICKRIKLKIGFK